MFHAGPVTVKRSSKGGSISGEPGILLHQTWCLFHLFLRCIHAMYLPWRSRETHMWAHAKTAQSSFDKVGSAGETRFFEKDCSTLFMSTFNSGLSPQGKPLGPCQIARLHTSNDWTVSGKIKLVWPASPLTGSCILAQDARQQDKTKSVMQLFDPAIWLKICDVFCIAREYSHGKQPRKTGMENRFVSQRGCFLMLSQKKKKTISDSSLLKMDSQKGCEPQALG